MQPFTLGAPTSAKSLYQLKLDVHGGLTTQTVFYVMFASDVTGGEPRNVLAWDSRPRMSSWFFNAKSIYEVETVVKREHRTKQRFASFSR